jgi:HK97 family phage major capsid protein
MLEIRKKLLEMELEALLSNAELRGSDKKKVDGIIALLSSSKNDATVTAETRSFTNWLRTGEQSAELRTANVLEIGVGAQGGYLCPQSWADTYQSALKSYSGLREAGANVVNKPTGRPFRMPFSNDVDTVGQRVDENQASTDAIPTASVNSPTVFRYAGKGCGVSVELFSDAAFDIGAYLADLFAQRIGKITNTEFTLGVGGGPSGVLPNIANTVTSAGGSAVALADLNSLPVAIDYAYRSGAVYTFNANTEEYLKNLVASGSGERMFPEMAEGMLNGFRYVVNVDFPDIAAGARAVAFGNFKRGVMIQDVTPILINSRELRAEYHQRYFNLYHRQGCVITDANALAVLVQHA